MSSDLDLLQENIDRLREKAPLLAFELGKSGCDIHFEDDANVEYQEQPETDTDVFFLYEKINFSLASSLLEQSMQVCFLASSHKAILSVLRHPKMKDLLESPGFNIYLLRDNEEDYKLLGWRFLFLQRQHFLAVGCEEEERTLCAKVEEFITSIELVASDYRDYGVNILKNVYRNTLHTSEVYFADHLQDMLKDRPAIVCGAGPSLMDHIEELAELQNRVVILGSGSAIPILMKAGIRPHLVSFVDPDPPTKPFEELANFDMPLLYQNRMSHEIFKCHKGPKIWMGSSGGYQVEQWLEQQIGFPDLFFDAGWNVANFGMRALSELGCRPIYFLGVDSCYDKEVMEDHEWMVRDINGIERVTRKDLFLGAKWVADFAKDHPHLPIVNACNGGILMESLPQAALPQIGKKLPVWYPREMIQDLLEKSEKFTVAPRRANQSLMTFFASLKRCQAHVEECVTILEEKTEKQIKACPSVGFFALFDVEIKDELAHKLFLGPLWDIWKYMILREQSSFLVQNAGAKFQEVLFYRMVIKEHISLLEKIS